MTNEEAEQLVKIVFHSGDADAATAAGLGLLAGVRRLNEALADVRTLDEWARRTIGFRYETQADVVTLITPGGPEIFTGDTPDAARHAAAEWAGGQAKTREAKQNAAAVADWTERNARRRT